ncbi:S-formylglutathione hydrolase [Chromobacterium sphagni]|uniref:S-formylglutathione hydrolase n=1 Tax=Chromobacterium sphagni TaxID=1903179 RepID=A0A1S1X5W1_9NEIS|nr:S-formylglutathione hydrolase [Chromobacterium sphagni]OHX14871.1 S-formylglutathione hydrolase [Chromobacterium sphagni]OHX22078.1 S-formylglutathione hydrolase [Chromobacterium sphagni]
MEKISDNLAFGGRQQQWRHQSAALGCAMRFGVYLPPAAAQHKLPWLLWLSGLTCSDENFSHKAGAQRVAAELGIALVMPDTSPRGEEAADDPAYDLGQGAGFYLNATQAPWSRHYRMYDYVTQELPALLRGQFPLNGRVAVAGHSMGGHGALVCALKRPQDYVSVSAFSPICHPVKAPWGRKAFAAYLGDDETRWREWDASLLLAERGSPLPIRVDIGLADPFLAEQLQPDALQKAARESDSRLELHRHAGYDHSYYFVASFIEAQLRFHARHLLA